MIAAVLRLSRHDCKALKITDPYSIHRVVYSLFDDQRTAEEKRASRSSGILYADKGRDFHQRQILLLSNREPNPPEYGEVVSKLIPEDFLHHGYYGFEVTVNPTYRDSAGKKLIAVRGREAVMAWFIQRAVSNWGFRVVPEQLQIQQLSVQRFVKAGQTLTHGSATLKGALQVLDRSRFIQSFGQGIGRGRAFGFGLLQIVPLNNPFEL
ncbi:MAG: type I-E CRISPR-associated protein Cas6/Cse3/CasE [Candidatus Sedimenticola sp. (ex Thyasira tokunagai)]